MMVAAPTMKTVFQITSQNSGSSSRKTKFSSPTKVRSRPSGDGVGEGEADAVDHRIDDEEPDEQDRGREDRSQKQWRLPCRKAQIAPLTERRRGGPGRFAEGLR